MKGYKFELKIIVPSNQIAEFPATCLLHLVSRAKLKYAVSGTPNIHSSVEIVIVDLYLHSTLNINSVQHTCIEISHVITILPVMINLKKSTINVTLVPINIRGNGIIMHVNSST